MEGRGELCAYKQTVREEREGREVMQSRVPVHHYSINGVEDLVDTVHVGRHLGHVTHLTSLVGCKDKVLGWATHMASPVRWVWSLTPPPSPRLMAVSSSAQL